MHYILCKDDKWTQTLKKELVADFSKEVKVIEGFPLIQIPSSNDLNGEYIAFSSTAVLNALMIPDGPVSSQVKMINDKLENLISDGVKVNFHVFALTKKYGILETGRADIFKGKVTSTLRKRGIKILKGNFDRSLGFLQILILPDRSIALSYLSSEQVKSYHSLISPFVGGFNNVEDDKKAPSRAFKKLVEAQEILGHKINEGDHLVDLGACPGGWTYVARKNGAVVTALDRSPLVSELMEDTKVDFLKSDAFRYEVNTPVDWVVSDIICAPERILELIEYWVKGRKCKHFVFTIKFQGHKDYGLLKKFKKFAKEIKEYQVKLKQLNANKNEVTVMGSFID